MSILCIRIQTYIPIKAHLGDLFKTRTNNLHFLITGWLGTGQADPPSGQPCSTRHGASGGTF